MFIARQNVNATWWDSTDAICRPRYRNHVISFCNWRYNATSQVSHARRTKFLNLQNLCCSWKAGNETSWPSFISSIRSGLHLKEISRISDSCAVYCQFKPHCWASCTAWLRRPPCRFAPISWAFSYSQLRAPAWLISNCHRNKLDHQLRESGCNVVRTTLKV